MSNELNITKLVKAMSRAAIRTVPGARVIPNKRKQLRKLSKRDYERAIEH